LITRHNDVHIFQYFSVIRRTGILQTTIRENMTQVQQQQLITAASASFKNVNLPKMRPKHIALVFGVMSYVFMKNIFSFSEDDPSSPEYQLESVSSSSSSVSLVALDEGMNETSSVIFNGIEESEWCLGKIYVCTFIYLCDFQVKIHLRFT
jgi:hypothetical protein